MIVTPISNPLPSFTYAQEQSEQVQTQNQKKHPTTCCFPWSFRTLWKRNGIIPSENREQVLDYVEFEFSKRAPTLPLGPENVIPKTPSPLTRYLGRVVVRIFEE